MAYAALVSLANTLEQITLHRPDPCNIPFSKQKIRALQEMVNFLLESLENDSECSNNKVVSHELETKIRVAAYQAEYVIETRVHDHYLTGSENDGDKNLEILNGGLEETIEEFQSIQKEVFEIKGRKGVRDLQQQPGNYRVRVSSPRRPSHSGTNCMVGFDDEISQMKERLTSPQQPRSLQIIPIVGMGGIGKTTFARKLYGDPQITQHFDILAWTTISQNYQKRESLLGLLSCIIDLPLEIHEKHDCELQEILYQKIKGKRYLVVMDDLWSERGWDDLGRCFPDDCRKSRILLTTRLTNIASYINPSTSEHHQMRFLNEDESWKLLQEKVFGENCCPLELEEVGNRIVENCGGLPLAVVTISGLLSKGNGTHDYWENVAENIRAAATMDDQFRDILMLSYKYLPHHLKACFLYAGLLIGDKATPISRLINLFVAEGFVKPDRSKSLEEIAEGYLMELVERNLFLVQEKGSNGKMKRCGVHDLLRDLCIKIGQMENCFCIVSDEKNIPDTPRGKDICPRLVITKSDINGDGGPLVLGRLPHEYLSCIRSLICLNRSFRHQTSRALDLRRLTIEYLSCLCSLIPFNTSFRRQTSRDYFSFKLLRVFDATKVVFSEFPGEIQELVNLRYLAFVGDSGVNFPSFISSHRSLQTLRISGLARWAIQVGLPSEYSTKLRFGAIPIGLPSEIWEMQQLRHIRIQRCFLPYPNNNGKKCLVLKSLETLSELENFRFSEDVLQRIPNVKKLKLYFRSNDSEFELGGSLRYLVHLSKLETLRIVCAGTMKCGIQESLDFPRTLIKLTLEGCRIPWECMPIVGSLPRLEVLKLRWEAFQGQVWEPTEGQFCQLKYLLLSDLDLAEWRAESCHFPCLQTLMICECANLEEIPSDIGDIPTLEMIELRFCSQSIINSAKEIQNAQHEFGNYSLQVREVDTRIDITDFIARFSYWIAAMRHEVDLSSEVLPTAGLFRVQHGN